MKNIYLITDYKGNFGSKYRDNPYRSGFNKELISRLLAERGFTVVWTNPAGSNPASFNGELVLYTSQEDEGLHYKSFLEDFILSAELGGSKVIPPFRLFRAHENKVFFEMIRKLPGNELINNLRSSWFGTLEEFRTKKDNFLYPIVIKTPQGSMSRGVYLASDEKQAVSIVRKISSTPCLTFRLHDIIRSLRHKGYLKESWHRGKFIVQQFVPGLKNDYKVLVYGRKFYVLLRETEKNGFRASGKGLLSFTRDVPDGLLEFSEKCFYLFNVPHASFDIGFDGKDFYLFEAQFLYFGTYTIEFSEFYFTRKNGNWSEIDSTSVLEEEYVSALAEYLER